MTETRLDLHLRANHFAKLIEKSSRKVFFCWFSTKKKIQKIHIFVLLAGRLFEY